MTATEVQLMPLVGSFADDKEKAREIRLNTLIPALDRGGEVVLDFTGVTGATQSFIHALISDIFRKYGADVLDRIAFRNCNETVRKIIGIVSDYMQESI